VGLALFLLLRRSGNMYLCGKYQCQLWSLDMTAPKKQYLKSKPVCKVTFRLPKEALRGARNVTIVGDFNEWSKTAAPMKILKDGSASLTLNLETSRKYHYRYLVDGERWENDWQADGYHPSPMAYEDNSVIVV
jgi:hypothetical protein